MAEIDKSDISYKYIGYYKIKIDGSERVKIYDKTIYSTNVIGDNIYFYSEAELGKPAVMKTDGSNRIYLNVLPVRNIAVDGEYIYFQNGYDGNSLYRMNLNGGNYRKLSDVSSYSLDINVYNDYVYITGEYPYRGLYKVKYDGSGLEKLVDKYVTSLNVEDEWIYYVIYDGGLWKMKVDGSENQMLLNEKGYKYSSLNIAGEWIYYLLYKYENGMERIGQYRLKKDGSKVEEIIRY